MFQVCLKLGAFGEKRGTKKYGARFVPWGDVLLIEQLEKKSHSDE